MSQKIQLGETGDSLVNKFNYNAEQLDNLNNQVQLHQEQINVMPKNVVIREYTANNFLSDASSYNAAYVYRCIISHPPLLWRFYIDDANYGKEFVSLDSAYYLYPDETGIGISFNYDLGDISKVHLEVISYE